MVVVRVKPPVVVIHVLLGVRKLKVRKLGIINVLISLLSDGGIRNSRI
jgi:hypothetical protein